MIEDVMRVAGGRGTVRVEAENSFRMVAAPRAEEILTPRNGPVLPGSLVFVALVFVVLVSAVTPIRGQGLDPASAAALAETLKILADPAGKGLRIADDPAAAEIDRQARSLAGSPELAQEVYGLAAEVFADLVKSTGGDVGKLNETLERAKSDPAGFAAILSPQTLQRLRELSVKISDTKR